MDGVGLDAVLGGAVQCGGGWNDGEDGETGLVVVGLLLRVTWWL